MTMHLAPLGLAMLAAAANLVAQPSAPIRVTPADGASPIAQAIRAAAPGSRLVIAAGTYREPTIIVDKPLEIVGEGSPVLDGEGQRTLMVVRADDVTVRGMHFRNVGTSFTEDRAAIRVNQSSRCVIDRNRFDDAFFAIYLAKAADCEVTRNVLRSSATQQISSGNGIHLWGARNITVEGNDIEGYRDGIYLEFSNGTHVRGNRSARNRRYGMHFMFSDDCTYQDNHFEANDAGVAVMYAARILMEGNRFVDSRGDAAYGLLLKDLTDARLLRNHFERNTTALMIEGATRLHAAGNRFERNGWAIRVAANAQDTRFEGNDFAGNTFDVATNGPRLDAEFVGNYWDRYAGYDLDHDGIGDVPHRPVRLFAVVAERFEPTLVLLRSFFVDLLESVERLFPSLTPTMLYDPSPAMRPRTGAVT